MSPEATDALLEQLSLAVKERCEEAMEDCLKLGEIVLRVRAASERLSPNVLSRLLLRWFGNECNAGVALGNASHAETDRIPQNRALGYQPAEPLRTRTALDTHTGGSNVVQRGERTASYRVSRQLTVSFGLRLSKNPAEVAFA